jgi:hypothetical protein
VPANPDVDGEFMLQTDATDVRLAKDVHKEQEGQKRVVASAMTHTTVTTRKELLGA